MTRFLIAAFLTSSLYAHQGNYQQGKDFAAKQSEKLRDKAKQADTSAIPFYQGADVPQASLRDGSLESAAAEAVRNDENAATVRRSHDRRIIIDTEHDPMIKDANRIADAPEKAAGGSITEEQTDVPGNPQDRDDIFTCEESGEEYAVSCTRNRKVELKVTPEVIEKISRGCTGHSGANGCICRECIDYRSGCDCGGYNFVRRSEKKVEVIRDEVVDTCQAYERMADDGLCEYASVRRSPAGETRHIEGEPVTRDHWEQTFIYRCRHPSKNNCEPLRAKGCLQIESRCLKKSGDVCVLWRQTFSCPNGVKRRTRYTAKGDMPWCITGDCADKPDWHANDEMLKAFSHLSVLKEAQGQIEDGKIFRSEDLRCGRHIMNFSDCCRVSKGWGGALGLTQCTAVEKKLAVQRGKSLCVRVGTYCSKKVLGVCVTKKTSFCCYSTKLQRLMHEHGRRQLGIGWGNAENPDCRGFTPDELSRIDFDKVDFGEAFNDIRNSLKIPDTQALRGGVNARAIEKNMKAMTKSAHKNEEDTGRCVKRRS